MDAEMLKMIVTALSTKMDSCAGDRKEDESPTNADQGVALMEALQAAVPAAARAATWSVAPSHQDYQSLPPLV